MNIHKNGGGVAQVVGEAWSASSIRQVLPFFASAELPASHFGGATGGDTGPAPSPVHLSRD